VYQPGVVARLRDLDGRKAERLVSEDEYRREREEILRGR
jgi:hypothetical protein